MIHLPKEEWIPKRLMQKCYFSANFASSAFYFPLLIFKQYMQRGQSPEWAEFRWTISSPPSRVCFAHRRPGVGRWVPGDPGHPSTPSRDLRVHRRQRDWCRCPDGGHHGQLWVKDKPGYSVEALSRTWAQTHWVYCSRIVKSLYWMYCSRIWAQTYWIYCSRIWAQTWA